MPILEATAYQSQPGSLPTVRLRATRVLPYWPTAPSFHCRSHTRHTSRANGFRFRGLPGVRNEARERQRPRQEYEGRVSGSPNSEEGIRNLETSEALTVLQILRIEEIALRLDCGGDN